MAKGKNYAKKTMERLVGIECKQCHEFFEDSKKLMQHEQQYHPNIYSGYSSHYSAGTAMSTFSSIRSSASFSSGISSSSE